MNVQHLEVHAGTTRDLVLYARDSANAPFNVASKTISWYVGRAPMRPDCDYPIVTKSIVVIGDPSATSFVVPVLPADTQYLRGDYEHMGKTTDDSGTVTVVVGGRFRVHPTLGV